MKKARVVFLDRDGVINKYPGQYKYVTSPKELRILPGTKVALKRLISGGFYLFIISNQAGVAKGLYTQRALDAITDSMLQQLGPSIVFENIFYCTHLPTRNCKCRKPMTGFIEKAAQQMKKKGMLIDWKNSYFIGDSMRDIETGRRAGLRTILVFQEVNTLATGPHGLLCLMKRQAAFLKQPA